MEIKKGKVIKTYRNNKKCRKIRSGILSPWLHKTKEKKTTTRTKTVGKFN